MMKKLNLKLLNKITSRYDLKAEVIKAPSANFNCPFCSIPTHCISVKHKEFEWGVIHVNIHTLLNPFPSVFVPKEAGESGYNSDEGQHLQISLITQTIGFLKELSTKQDQLLLTHEQNIHQNTVS